MEDYKTVLGCSISYRRNIKDMPFVKTLTDSELAIGVSRSLSEIFNEEFEFKSLKNISLLDCQKLKEEGLFTEELIGNKDISAYGISYDKNRVIYINEQEHIRLIAFDKSFDLEKCFNLANIMDDMVLDKLEMAFDNNYGYLTSNPKLMGTGMEIKVLMFIPALFKSGKYKKVQSEILGKEFEFYDLSGKVWNEESPFVILKNKYTFGYKENEFAEKIKRIAVKIHDLELSEENGVFEISASGLVDEIYRSYGILGSCYRISYLESIKKIADILWGIRLKVLKCKKSANILEFLSSIADNHLGENLNVKELEKLRAKKISKFLVQNIEKGDVDV